MHKIVYLFTSGGSLLALAALFAIRTATQRFSTYNKGFQVRKTQSKPLLLCASALQRLLLRASFFLLRGGHDHTHDLLLRQQAISIRSVDTL